MSDYIQKDPCAVFGAVISQPPKVLIRTKVTVRNAKRRGSEKVAVDIVSKDYAVAPVIERMPV